MEKKYGDFIIFMLKCTFGNAGAIRAKQNQSYKKNPRYANSRLTQNRKKERKHALMSKYSGKKDEVALIPGLSLLKNAKQGMYVVIFAYL